MKDTALQILGQFYEYQYLTEEYDYETIETYYVFLDEVLGLATELKELDITGPADLQDALLHRETKI